MTPTHIGDKWQTLTLIRNRWKTPTLFRHMWRIRCPFASLLLYDGCGNVACISMADKLSMSKWGQYWLWNIYYIKDAFTLSHYTANTTQPHKLKASFSVCFIIFSEISNKSHILKALITLSHSWSPFFLLTYLYGENELWWGHVRPFGVFSWEKPPPVSRELICNETLLHNYPCPI